MNRRRLLLSSLPAAGLLAIRPNQARANSGIINVIPTGVDDTAALAAAVGFPGAMVVLSPDEYLVSELMVPAPGVSIHGGGATIKVMDGRTSGIFQAVNPQNVTIEDLTLDLNGANTPNGNADWAQHGVYLAATGAAGIRNCRISRVRIINGHQCGIRVSGTDGQSYPVEAVIEDSAATGCKFGILVQNSTQARIKDCDALGNAVSGIEFLAGTDLQCSGNHAIGNGTHGIVADAGMRNFSIKDNTCSRNGLAGSFGYGIVVSVRGSQFTVGGNTCDGNYNGGISIDPRDPAALALIQAANGTVSDNVCTNSVHAAAHGIYTNYAKDLSISGNICSGNGGRGIQLIGSHSVVGGNVLRANGFGLGVQFDGAASTPMGNHVIGPNVYDANTLGPIDYDGRAVNVKFIGDR